MSGHHHHHHEHGHSHGEAPHVFDVAQLQRDADIMAPCLTQSLAALQRLAPVGGVTRILDVGCGPGVASLALAAAFPAATVSAVDQSPELLQAVRGRAQAAGLSARVSTLQKDLDHGLGDVGPLDLVWASMSMHHVASPAALAQAIHANLRTGGLVAVLEFGDAMRTLPGNLGFGAPGFTQRLQAATAAALEAHLPAGALKLDWPAILTSAGFAVVEQHLLAVDIPAPLPTEARQWVQEGLARSTARLAPSLSADDQATLAILQDPSDARGVLLRNDVEIHASRRLFVARR